MADGAAERKLQTRALFDGLAPEYDAPGAFAHFGRRLVAVAGIEPGRRVLDVACGRGAVLVPAAERTGEAGESIGIDLSEAMVRAAHAEVARRGLRSRVAVMDAEALDFPDAAFDAVLCGFGLMFFPDPDRALREFRRVLRPGGRLGISTWQVSLTEDLREVLSEHGLDRGQPPGWIADADALARLVERAGFGTVRVRADTATFCHANIDAYWQQARGTAVRRTLDTLDPAGTARIRAALAARLRRYERTNGIHVAATALLAVAWR